jgi:uncharacterized membrane protein YhhN
VLTVWILAALVGVLLWCEFKSWRAGVWLSKPLASAAFVFLALELGATNTRYGLWILAGLMACWLGDLLLIPRHQGSFKAGILSFLAGHFLYSAAFIVFGVEIGWVLLAGVPLGVAAWFVGRRLMESVGLSLRGPVTAYILVISGMLALGIGAWVRSGHTVFLVAPSAFYLSDLAVARNRFLEPGFVNRLVGLPLYYVAQALFAWSVTLA